MQENMDFDELDFLLNQPEIQPHNVAPDKNKKSAEKRQAHAAKIADIDAMRHELHELQRSANGVTEIYQQEKQQRIELESRVAADSKQIAYLEKSLMICENKQAHQKAKMLPVQAEDLVRLFMQRISRDAPAGTANRNERLMIMELQDFCSVAKISIPDFESPQKRRSKEMKQLAKRPKMRSKAVQTELFSTTSIAIQTDKLSTQDKGIQHKNTTTTRGTTTAALIQLVDVGTSFPEPKPALNAQDILDEILCWKIQALSPIHDLPVATTASKGTCTDLCNVYREVDYLPELPAQLKRSHSRSPSRAEFDRIKDEMAIPTDSSSCGQHIAKNVISSLPHNQSYLAKLPPQVFEEIWQVMGKMVIVALQSRPANNISQADFHNWFDGLYENAQNQLPDVDSSINTSSSGSMNNSSDSHALCLDLGTDFIKELTPPPPPPKLKVGLELTPIRLPSLPKISQKKKKEDKKQERPKSPETAINFLSHLNAFNKHDCDFFLNIDLDEEERQLLELTKTTSQKKTESSVNCKPNSPLPPEQLVTDSDSEGDERNNGYSTDDSSHSSVADVDDAKKDQATNVDYESDDSCDLPDKDVDNSEKDQSTITDSESDDNCDLPAADNDLKKDQATNTDSESDDNCDLPAADNDLKKDQATNVDYESDDSCDLPDKDVDNSEKDQSTITDSESDDNCDLPAADNDLKKDQATNTDSESDDNCDLPAADNDLKKDQATNTDSESDDSCDLPDKDVDNSEKDQSTITDSESDDNCDLPAADNDLKKDQATNTDSESDDSCDAPVFIPASPNAMVLTPRCDIISINSEDSFKTNKRIIASLFGCSDDSDCADSDREHQMPSPPNLIIDEPMYEPEYIEQPNINDKPANESFKTPQIPASIADKQCIQAQVPTPSTVGNELIGSVNKRKRKTSSSSSQSEPAVKRFTRYQAKQQLMLDTADNQEPSFSYAFSPLSPMADSCAEESECEPIEIPLESVVDNRVQYPPMGLINKVLDSTKYPKKQRNKRTKQQQNQDQQFEQKIVEFLEHGNTPLDPGTYASLLSTDEGAYVVVNALIKAYDNITDLNVLERLLSTLEPSKFKARFLIDRLMHALEQLLFKPKERPKIELSYKHLQLYLRLIQIQTNIAQPVGSYVNPARLLLVKILYHYKWDKELLILEVLIHFPTVLPRENDRSYAKDDPLITVIKHILMSRKYDVSDPVGAQRTLISKLRYEYNFQPFEPNRPLVIGHLIEKLKAGRVRDLSYAFALFCKCNPAQFVIKDVLEKMLLPLVDNFCDMCTMCKTYDDRMECLLQSISMILKQLPLTNCVDVTVYVALFQQVLVAVPRPEVQQAAVQAILRTQRFGFGFALGALKNYRPNYQLSFMTRAMMRSFGDRYTKHVYNNLIKPKK